MELSKNHRAEFRYINAFNPSKDKLKCHGHANKKPNEVILPYLQQAGFGEVIKLGNYKIDVGLITAMVERWRPETHTFHLSIGECTITLGLNVFVIPVSGSNFVNVKDVCQEYLGVIPPEGATKGNSIKLKWLKDTFDNVGENASEVEKQASCRAYILRMIGGLLMSDKFNNRVHLKYLSILGDLNKTSHYTWGSAVLATLYRELCLATKPDVMSMGRCALLLQNWAWCRLSCVAPDALSAWIFPLAQRFNSGGLNFSKVPHNDIEGYRNTIDHMIVQEPVFLTSSFVEDSISDSNTRYPNKRSTLGLHVPICTAIISSKNIMQRESRFSSAFINKFRNLQKI
uniref:Protein MAIN-LIKE 2-like n=1 Tax=Cicer arietinum TaxID=3827 RepID=A0A3Q7XUY8_CICAR|nr:protein MAIN-LIKE 2-like [Cicer arietinum]